MEIFAIFIMVVLIFQGTAAVFTNQTAANFTRTITAPYKTVKVTTIANIAIGKHISVSGLLYTTLTKYTSATTTLTVSRLTCTLGQKCPPVAATSLSTSRLSKILGTTSATTITMALAATIAKASATTSTMDLVTTSTVDLARISTTNSESQFSLYTGFGFPSRSSLSSKAAITFKESPTPKPAMETSSTLRQTTITTLRKTTFTVTIVVDLTGLKDSSASSPPSNLPASLSNIGTVKSNNGFQSDSANLTLSVTSVVSATTTMSATTMIAGSTTTSATSMMSASSTLSVSPMMSESSMIPMSLMISAPSTLSSASTVSPIPIISATTILPITVPPSMAFNTSSDALSILQSPTLSLLLPISSENTSVFVTTMIVPASTSEESTSTPVVTVTLSNTPVPPAPSTSTVNIIISLQTPTTTTVIVTPTPPTSSIPTTVTQTTLATATTTDSLLTGAGTRVQPPHVFLWLASIASMIKSVKGQTQVPITTIAYPPVCPTDTVCTTVVIQPNRTLTMAAPMGSCAPNGSLNSKFASGGSFLRAPRFMVLLAKFAAIFQSALANTTVTITVVDVTHKTVNITQLVTTHSSDTMSICMKSDPLTNSPFLTSKYVIPSSSSNTSNEISIASSTASRTSSVAKSSSKSISHATPTPIISSNAALTFAGYLLLLIVAAILL